MSRLAPSTPPVRNRKRSFAIVASLFNEKYVRGLIDHATTELRKLRPKIGISLYQVPGAFEIPVIVQQVAARKNVDAILALGVILQGQTSHAQNLARSVTDALQQIAIGHGIPIVNAVLTPETTSQAHARCLGSKINRGTEAARTAVAIADLMKELRTRLK